MSKNYKEHEIVSKYHKGEFERKYIMIIGMFKELNQ